MRSALWSALFRCSCEKDGTARTNGARAKLKRGSAKMTNFLEIQLIKISANLALYLGFSSSTRYEDSDVGVMEQLASELQGMSEEDQRKFSDTIRAIAPDYDKKQKSFSQSSRQILGWREARFNIISAATRGRCASPPWEVCTAGGCKRRCVSGMTTSLDGARRSATSRE